MWGRLFNLISSGTCGFILRCGLEKDLSGTCDAWFCHNISNAWLTFSGDFKHDDKASGLKNCSSGNLVSWLGMKLYSSFVKKAKIK